MDATEAQLAQLRADLQTARTRVTELESSASEVTAMTAAIGLSATGVKPAERLAAVQSLTSLQREVFRITGEASPETAVAALSAMKTKSDRTDALEKEIAGKQTIALRGQLDGIWEAALKEGRLSKADSFELEQSLTSFSDGVVTEKTVAAAKVAVAKLSVRTVHRQPEGGGVGDAGDFDPAKVELTPEDRNFAKLSGVNPDFVLKAKRLKAQKAHEARTTRV